jgi:hypothetical protein
MSRKTTAVAVALVLSLSTFVLFAGEAWAAEQPAQEQPSQATQQGTVESTTTVNGQEAAEPLLGTTTSVETPPVEKPSAQTPFPPTNQETSPAKEPAPLPVEPEPSTLEPAPAPQPASQRFAVLITDGEVVESDPEPAWSVTDPESARDVVTYSAPNSAAPVGEAGASVPGTSSDAGPSVPAGEDAPLSTNQESEPVLGSVSPAVFEEAPATAIAARAGSHLGTRGAHPPAALLKPSAAPTGPASVGGASRFVSSLGTAAASVGVGAVDTVRSAAAGVLGTLSGGSTELLSHNDSQQSSEENAPQPPTPPLAPPVGGSSFSLSGGFGQIGPGGGFAPLLVGILAFAATLLRRDFMTYLVSCEMPKPSSALLLPLERPG